MPSADPVTEHTLIGAMIVSAEARAVAIERCRPDDFSVIELRAVFGVIY